MAAVGVDEVVDGTCWGETDFTGGGGGGGGGGIEGIVGLRGKGFVCLSVETFPPPFPPSFCFLPFTMSAIFGLPSSWSTGGCDEGGGVTGSVVVGRGGKFVGAKSNFWVVLFWGR